MKRIIPTLSVVILGSIFFLSSLYLYKTDIAKHDREILKVAKEVKDKLDSFNERIIIRDNELIKLEQSISSIKSDEILILLKRIEESLNAKTGVSK